MPGFRSPAQSGQVGLIVLMIMVVVSTVGISVATRTNQDLQSSRETQDATRAFSAAEAAIENVLSRGQNYLDQTQSGEFADGSLVPNTDINYTIQPQTQLGIEVLRDQVAQVSLSGAAAGNQVRISWGSAAACSGNPASLMIAIINTAGATPTVRYAGYALCDRTDGLTVVAPNGSAPYGSVTLTLQNGDTALRLRPLYNSTELRVEGVGGYTLPVQQYVISSVARNTESRETKAVRVQRTTEFAPSIFDFALLSGGNIIKQ